MHLTRSDLKAAIQGEASKPATCARINGSGVLEEGILLDLQNQLSNGWPMLVVGNRYILRAGEYGAVMMPHDAQHALVRRAIIERPAQGEPLLAQPNGGNVPLLLHADLHVKLIDRARQRVRFWYGIGGTAQVALFSRTQALVSFAKDGDEARLFYTDGRVIRIIRTNDRFTVANPTLEEQASLRLERVKAALTETVAFTDLAERTRKRDGLFNELLAILAVGGKRSHAVSEAASAFLISQVPTGLLRTPKMRTLAEDLLAGINRKRMWELKAALGEPTLKPTAPDAPVLANAERRDSPKAHLARKNQRRIRDRERTLATKGPSGGGGNSRKK